MLERDAVDPQLERQFFQSLCLPNGTHKTTAERRLQDFDNCLASLLPTGRTIHLLDVGISSGVTTLELLERLEAGGHRVTGVGIDIRVHAYLRRFLGVDFLFDDQGNILQMATPFFARGRPEASSSTAKAQVLRVGIATAERILTKRWAAGSTAAMPLTLVSSRLLNRRGFSVREHDINLPMAGSEETFDVIRAANVFNLAYFKPAVLRNMLHTVLGSLKQGGLMAVVRTHGCDGSNHGTIFRKPRPGQPLQVACRVGRGSEVETLLVEGTSSLPA